MKLTSILKSLDNAAIKYGASKPFICGGVARDKFMNRLDNISDLDITTGDSTIKILAQEFSILLKKIYLIKYESFNDGHASIFLKDLKLDFSSNFNAPSINQFLISNGITSPTNMQKEMFSRDFTCNSLLLSTDLKNIKDPTKNGISDINKRIIKCNTYPESAFIENNNRAIRSIYLSAKLDFDVDKSIVEFIKNNPNSIFKSSRKFLIEKLNKSIKLNPERTVYLLNKMNLWNHIPMSDELLPYYKNNLKK